MKRLVLTLLLGVCVSGCASPRRGVQAEVPPQRLNDHPERYIVAGVDNEETMPAGHAGSSPKGYDSLTVYGPTSRAARLLHGVEHDYGLREVAAWPIAPLHMHCAVLELTAGADPQSVIAALTQDRRVRIAQPLQTFSTQTAAYDDPYVGLQRAFQQMDVPQAHAWSRGEGVRVAIVDTGADTTHPDLRGVVVQVGNFVDGDSAQFQRDRHGTELAGIIAAVANNHEGIVGIAPGARLLVFKACWQLHDDADAARCNSFTLAQAITAAMDAHAQIINLSLSGPADPLLRDLIREGLRRGILIVGAAPLPGAAEERGRRDEQFLAVEGVIQVADGGIQGVPGTPLHAPGKEILTLFPGGRYDFASGTSLSTAHVTGAVALLLKMDPKLTSAGMYQLLRTTSTHREDPGGDSINACAAITSLMGHGLCPHEDSGASRVAMH